MMIKQILNGVELRGESLRSIKKLSLISERYLLRSQAITLNFLKKDCSCKLGYAQLKSSRQMACSCKY